MNEMIRKITAQLKSVVIGKDEVIGFVLAAVLSGGHVLLEDMPGTGKTTLALALSRSLGLDHRRIQLTPDTVASDITGYCAYDSNTQSFRFHQGAVMTELLLADELNRTSGKTQAALLEAMEERAVTVDGVTHKLPELFCVIATQNPQGTAGTSEIPLSQLDRFTVRLSLGNVDKSALKQILRDRSSSDPLDKVSQICSREDLLALTREVREVYFSDDVYDYVCELCAAAEASEDLSRGISPRGALALCRIAKAVAYLSGRDHVIPEDIRRCFVPVCAHRVILTSQARFSGRKAEDILSDIVSSTGYPEDKALRGRVK